MLGRVERARGRGKVWGRRPRRRVAVGRGGKRRLGREWGEWEESSGVGVVSKGEGWGGGARSSARP